MAAKSKKDSAEAKPKLALKIEVKTAKPGSREAKEWEREAKAHGMKNAKHEK